MISTTPPPEIHPLVPLEDVDVPAWPERAALKMAALRIRTLLTRSDQRPFIAEDRLDDSVDVFSDMATPAFCAPLMAELDETLASWATNPAPKQWIKPLVLPPCDEQELLSRWANRHQHEVLAPPTRDALLTDTSEQQIDLSGDGVLVIPQLEAWFLRHRCGLGLIRTLLTTLAGLERHCVVGCNSWAWAFLCKAVDAHLILPEPLTFEPFDEPRLRRWLADIARQQAEEGTRFRLSRNGENVFALDRKGRPRQAYFETLAARSRGIAWVAWHLWQHSLKKASEEVDNDCSEDDQQTLWVVALEEFSLPGSDGAQALLILQALLIHGSLSARELERVLPDPGFQGMHHALHRAGFIGERDGRYYCRARAYPAIRDGLATAGFPLDGY
ncbi:hypothetical protein SAMN05421848_1572 [Kushneria avicenniae]|uniref:Uncharacterized protein n=1 Tax=Kushneria avicenniae TaxID=402385 RepID=A0A1I1JHJ0_9GAMM|nr:hypothetical protein [Kushneria avicenniae]SFC48014.1 hypothetical protein SAMN05421848_1572 [Kushneria avicenniae]